MNQKKINKKIAIILFGVVIVALILSLFIYKKAEQIEKKSKITEYLKNKYNVIDVKYIKKENLLEVYNTIAGDSGSGRRKLDSYIYYYEFMYNNLKTYAYIIDDKISDDYYYDKQLEYAHNEFEQYIQKPVSAVHDYLDSEELLHYQRLGDTAPTRNAVINIPDYSYNIIDKAFIDKFIEVHEKINSSLDDMNFKLYIQFKDFIVYLGNYKAYKNDTNSKYTINFKINHFKNDSELIKDLDTYTQTEHFYILNNTTNEAISWCINNQKGWDEYLDFKDNEKIKNTLNKYTNIEYIIQKWYSSYTFIYTKDFEELKNIFIELKSKNLYTKDQTWTIIITDNYSFYNILKSKNAYENFKFLDDILDYKAKKLSYIVDFNSDIYQNYLKSDNPKYNTYFLNYTSDSKYCNKNDDYCTILYGLN